MAGTHVAVRTERQVLSPAAFTHFRYKVNRLLRGGETTQALGLWGSVVGIRRAGTPAGAAESGFPELPVLCCPGEGSNSLGWGLGAAEEWLPQHMSCALSRWVSSGTMTLPVGKPAQEGGAAAGVRAAGQPPNHSEPPEASTLRPRRWCAERRRWLRLL